MESPLKKIAVIGGGFAGLMAISCLKEVGGFDPVCFEKTDRLGGTWGYRTESITAVASTMSTTILNHSKEMGAISNFPPRKEYNNFMRHSEILQYVMEFVEANDLLRHIRYNSETVEVKRSDDYKESGKWTVTVKDKDGKTHTDVYDGVWVCVGHINRPKIPQYPGLDLFKGKIMHTHSLKEVTDFKDKKVLVVGMGCSALDAAVESTSVAKQVYLSTRSGAHVISRTGPSGYPYDYLLLRRYITKLLDILPRDVASWLLETIYLDRQFDHRMYSVPPDHHILSKDPVLNDHIWSKMLSGSVLQRPDIERFTENGVIFQGSSDVIDIDVVIMATGYTWGFPFIEEGIVVQEEDGTIDLYKCMFPPHLPHSSLVVIGFCLPFGPGYPVGELMCRWAAHIFAGKGHLPSEEIMLQDIKERHSRNLLGYTPSEKMSVRVDFTQFLDEIASQFGAKPNLLKIFFTDFKLFLKLAFGPCLPYQYRLQGPFKWDGARRAIMTCEERIHFPMTRTETKGFENSNIIIIVKKILRWILSY